MSRLSFRQRLTVFTAAGIALVLIVGSVATYLVVRSQLRGQIDESLSTQSTAVVIRRSEVGVGLLQTRPAPLQRATKMKNRNATVPRAKRGLLTIVPPKVEFGNAPSFFQLIDTSGETVAPSGKRFNLPVALPVSQRAIAVARTQNGSYFTDIEVRGTRYACR
jgi:hypothetical protein